MQVANEQIDWREADWACQSSRPSLSNSLEQDNVRRKRLLVVRLLEIQTGKAWQIQSGCVALLRHLTADETFGLAARKVLARRQLA